MSSAAQSFTRLVRFEDENGQVQYGEAGQQWEGNLHGRTLPIFDGDPMMGNPKLSGRTASVHKVRNIPSGRCNNVQTGADDH